MPLPVGATLIQIEARGPTTVAAITGVCSSSTKCSFVPAGSASATVTFPHDARVAWTRTLENPTAAAGAYDSAGNLIVVTCSFDGNESKVTKLDPDGHTIWSHPGYEGTEISIGGDDEVYIRSSEQKSIWILGSDGYLEGAGNLGNVDSPVYFDDPYFFQHRMVTTSDIFASVGALNGTTIYGYGPHYNWTRTLASSSLEQIARTATQLLVSVANATGGADLLTFGLDGTPQATIANIAPHQDAVKFGIMANGDVISVACGVCRRRAGRRGLARSANPSEFRVLAPTTYDGDRGPRQSRVLVLAGSGWLRCRSRDGERRCGMDDGSRFGRGRARRLQRDRLRRCDRVDRFVPIDLTS